MSIQSIETYLNKYDFASLFFYYSQQIEKWFNPNTFDWKLSYMLAIECNEQFDLWWNPHKYNFAHSYFLVKYCKNNICKWYPYIENKASYFDNFSPEELLILQENNIEIEYLTSTE